MPQSPSSPKKGDTMPIHPTPTLIDPADIRPGDVVERRQRFTIEARYVEEDEIRLHTKQDWLDHLFGVVWANEDDGWTWHLVHRPDPDAEVIEAMAKVLPTDGVVHGGIQGALADLRRLGFDVVRRGWPAKPVMAESEPQVIPVHDARAEQFWRDVLESGSYAVPNRDATGGVTSPTSAPGEHLIDPGGAARLAGTGPGASESAEPSADTQDGGNGAERGVGDE